jgi:hypothetical protein
LFPEGVNDPNREWSLTDLPVKKEENLLWVLWIPISQYQTIVD